MHEHCRDVTAPDGEGRRSPFQRTREALVGQPLSSDSAELRALVLLGVRHVREVLLEDAYNDAVDAGDFDETADWIRGTHARRRSHG